jgi:CDP-6-deoxy-D-xylo-4-hexulose-3-dehydrase/perosamine synthetase
MVELVNQVMTSGRISYGPMSAEFERRFGEMHDCCYTILSNSGTSSLMVALQALKELHGWADGDEVIVPATTFVATSNIVLHCRMQPVFVDVDPETYNMDPEKIDEVITSRTRAIIPAHLFGQPANMGRIRVIAAACQLKIIEDSCETMFVRHGDHPVGSLGDIGCFSTYAAHLLVTGVGGLGITNNPDYAARMRSLVNHGLSIDNLNSGKNFAPRPMAGRRFRFDSCGHSFRLTEFEAAVGLAQLETVDEMLRIRGRNARHLTAGLEHTVNAHYGNPLRTPRIAEGNEHAWMMYSIVLNPVRGQAPDKEPLMKYLNECGIETRDMLPILGQPLYRYLDPNTYPVSKWILNSGFYIGCHQGLESEDIQYVVETIEEFYAKEARIEHQRNATAYIPAATPAA